MLDGIVKMYFTKFGNNDKLLASKKIIPSELSILCVYTIHVILLIALFKIEILVT